MNENGKVVYIFPIHYVMIPLLICAVFISAFAYEVIHPVCSFLKSNCFIMLGLFFAFLILIGYLFLKKRKSIKLGVGAALAIGQFILLLVIIMFAIASVADPQKVDLFSIGTTAIVAVLSFAYGCFNCKMVVDAFSESSKNSNTLLIVGIVGSLIDIIVLMFA